MPFADAMMLMDHFSEVPPRHVSAALAIGWRPKGREESSELTVEDIRALRTVAGGGGHG